MGLEVGWNFIPISFPSSFLVTMMSDKVTEKSKQSKENEGLFLSIQTEVSERHYLIEQANRRACNCIYYLLEIHFGISFLLEQSKLLTSPHVVSNKLGLRADF